jgi:hypothetical protein
MKSYMLVAVNDRTKYVEKLNAQPLTLAQAYTMRSKFNLAKDVRINIVQLGAIETVSISATVQA